MMKMNKIKRDKTAGLFRVYYKSPIGFLEICGTNDLISSLYFIDGETSGTSQSNSYLENCVKQLDEYFVGNRKEFGLNLEPKGTPFQKKVWNKLMDVPFGKTQSYMELSKKLGDEKAIRAVANANGQNEISIIIPCHRIIGSDGSLTGYGGGLWRKKWLLEHEQKFSGGSEQMDFFKSNL